MCVGGGVFRNVFLNIFWSTLGLVFLPTFLGEFYWKPYLSFWPLLPSWCCVSSPLPPRVSFCVPGPEERRWMSALPSWSVLWQARNSGTLGRSSLSCWVNTFAYVLVRKFGCFNLLDQLEGKCENERFCLKTFNLNIIRSFIFFLSSPWGLGQSLSDFVFKCELSISGCL